MARPRTPATADASQSLSLVIKHKRGDISEEDRKRICTMICTNEEPGGPSASFDSS